MNQKKFQIKTIYKQDIYAFLGAINFPKKEVRRLMSCEWKPTRKNKTQIIIVSECRIFSRPTLQGKNTDYSRSTFCGTTLLSPRTAG